MGNCRRSIRCLQVQPNARKARGLFSGSNTNGHSQQGPSASARNVHGSLDVVESTVLQCSAIICQQEWRRRTLVISVLVSRSTTRDCVGEVQIEGEKFWSFQTRHACFTFPRRLCIENVRVSYMLVVFISVHRESETYLKQHLRQFPEVTSKGDELRRCNRKRCILRSVEIHV